MNEMWKRGDIAKIKKGWFESGRRFRVIGQAIYWGQWWVPVIDVEGSDPEFYKEVCLEKD